jgi:hypothetical protein
MMRKGEWCLPSALWDGVDWTLADGVSSLEDGLK